MTTIKIWKETFEADTLLGCVSFLRSKNVKWVDLIWTCNKVFEIDCPDRWPFRHEESIRARYYGEVIDREYSYIGLFDEAFSDFAKGYSCWDDAELTIIDGILTGYNDGYDPDASEFPDDDETVDILDVYRLVLNSVEYWDDNARKWREML